MSARTPQLRLSLEHELIVDQFAGGGMRMLQPRELYRAQGFPENYRIDVTYGGAPLTKTAQVRMCGNSVSPPVAAAVVAANFSFAQLARAA